MSEVWYILTAMAGWSRTDGAIRASVVGSAAFEGFCRVFFASYCTLAVEGYDRLPRGPFLLCSNHSSHADSAALMTASGRSFRSFALVGASDYFFQSRPVRWSVSPWMNVIPIERSARPKALANCLDECRRFLEQTTGALILYPEGTRSPDGEMLPFKPGVGFFVSELGVPVVPAYIDGTHSVLPKGCFVPRQGSVNVRFGEALALAAPPHNRGETLRIWRRMVVEQLYQNIRALGRGSHVQGLAARAGQNG
jgi:1-acyl-sn-glycerol-3-phosphate acyltransferase